ncbi:MAG: FHA domain-containing protein [Phycisphaerae bacterium]
MAFIEVYFPDGHVEHFDLNKSSMTIGRSTEADITIQLPPVSRVHARIEKTPKGRWGLADLNSRNKTFVNSQAVQTHVLTNKDIFYLGSVKVVFQDTTGDSNEKIEQTVHLKSKKKEKVNTCPRCKTEMPEHAVVCMGCGYNVKTGKSPKLQIDGAGETGEVVGLIPVGGKTLKKKDTVAKPTALEIQMQGLRKWIIPAAIVAVIVLAVVIYLLFR